MPASLKFESAAGTTTADLSQVKIIALEDNTGNKYTLDITTNDLKLEYKPHGSAKVSHTVNGLATALGKLLTTDGSTPGKSVLAEKIAEKEVVDALIPELAKDDGATGIYTKKGVDGKLANKADKSELATKADKSELAKKADTSALADKADKSELATKADKSELAKKADTSALADKANTADVYTKIAADTSFVKTDGSNISTQADKGKALVDVLVPALATVGTDDTKKVYTKGTADTSFVKTDGFNISTQADKGKALANAILAVQDGNKSVLVDKLGGFLAATDIAYGDKNDQTAKVFLGDKGLKGDPGLKGADGAQGPKGEKGEQGANGTSPSAAEVIAHPNFAIDVTEEQVKNFVQKEISQPQIFDIPSDPNAPISADW